MKKYKKRLTYIFIILIFVFLLYLMIDFLVIHQGVFRKKQVSRGYVNNLHEIEKIINFPLQEFPSKGKIFYIKIKYPNKSTNVKVFGFVYCNENKIKKFISINKFNKMETFGAVSYAIPKESGWPPPIENRYIKGKYPYFAFQTMTYVISRVEKSNGVYTSITFILDPKDGRFTGEMIKSIR